MTDESFRVVGSGLTVYQDDEPIEGPTMWLDSPQAVLDFVERDDVMEVIAGHAAVPPPPSRPRS